MLKISNAACSYVNNYKNIEKLYKSPYIDSIVTKTCTLKPINNNDKFYYHDGFGAINSIGLDNKGLEYFIDIGNKLPKNQVDLPIKNNKKIYIPDRYKKYIISVNGKNHDDICSIFKKLEENKESHDMVELNVSCPNYNFETNFYQIENFDLCLNNIHSIYNGNIGLKLKVFFDQNEIEEILKIIIKYPKIKYLVCSNTLPNGILYNKQNKMMGSISGKYLKPFSLFNCNTFNKLIDKYYNKRYFDHPKPDIFGCGGINNIKDVYQYMDNGCNGIQIATSLIENGSNIFKKLLNDKI